MNKDISNNLFCFILGATDYGRIRGMIFNAEETKSRFYNVWEDSGVQCGTGIGLYIDGFLNGMEMAGVDFEDFEVHALEAVNHLNERYNMGLSPAKEVAGWVTMVHMNGGCV